MRQTPDHIIYCISQPSLSAANARDLLASLKKAATDIGCPTQAIRLEGSGPGLPDALRLAKNAGALNVVVQPIGFAMGASILAWLPGAIAYWQTAEGEGVAVWLKDPPDPNAVLPAMIAVALDGPPARSAHGVKPSLGKAGWQYLPDHDTHILVCTGPRCAFRGAGTLTAQLKRALAEEGLSDRCLTTTTGCLFPCNQGPLIALYPQNAWYVVPDEDALRQIVREVIGKGADRPHLRLAVRPEKRVMS